MPRIPNGDLFRLGLVLGSFIPCKKESLLAFSHISIKSTLLQIVIFQQPVSVLHFSLSPTFFHTITFPALTFLEISLTLLYRHAKIIAIVSSYFSKRRTE